MRLAAILLVLLAACGGGGPSVSGVVTPAGTLRTDLLYAYYGQDSATVLETAPHANMVWAAEFYGVTEQIATLTFAKQAGMKAVVPMPLCLTPLAQIEGEATTWLQRLRGLGLLDNVVAVAWCDEPNTVRSGSWTDANATAAIAAVRRAMVAVNLQAAVAVIYACSTLTRPGSASADWIGCDDYDSGCTALATFYDGWGLKAGQRFILLPGGADPWRQDPACFTNHAERDSRVIAVVPFIWQTVTDGVTMPGIRVNGLRPLYCQAGNTIKSLAATCPT